MLSLFALLFAQQPVDLLPQPALAVGAWEHPAETVRSVLGGEMWSRAQSAGLWQELQEQPGFGLVRLGWSAISAPTGGDPTVFVNALAGGGIAAALVARDGAEPGLVAVARLGDADRAEACLEQIALLIQVPPRQMRGETWELPLGEAVLAREGGFLLFASSQALMIQCRERKLSLAETGTSTPALAPGPAVVRQRALASVPPASVWVWASGALLRVNGYPELPNDLGASLLAADLHEALRVSDWAGATLLVNGEELRAELVVPEPAGLPESHAPFRPGSVPVSVPKIGGEMMRGVIVRDFGGWYNARDLYANPAAVAGSVEGDGNLRLLFGRDFGPEVLAWMEPQARLLIARNSDAGARALDLELPAGALGLKLKPDAPAGIGQGFINAFLAAVSLTNFQAGAADEKQLLLGMEQLADGSLMYVGRRPALGAGISAPLSHNAEPALYLGAGGEIWLSSSIGLLREIIAAPVEMVASEASWAELQIPPVADLLHRARGAMVAQQMLKNGGDLVAAEHFADLVEAGARLLDGAKLRFGPSDGFCTVRMEVFARAR